MEITKLTVVSILYYFICTFKESDAQGTNLLQQYIKQYFSDYRQNTVRSYKLYGNGQNGAADYHGELPIPFETTGKVKSLIFSTASSPPLSPPRASQKSSGGVVESAWVYQNQNPPSPTNSFHYYPPMQQVNYFHQPQPYPTQPGLSVGKQATNSEVKFSPLLQSQPLAESRMGEIKDSPVPVITISEVNLDEGNAEIPMKSTMTF